MSPSVPWGPLYPRMILFKAVAVPLQLPLFISNTLLSPSFVHEILPGLSTCPHIAMTSFSCVCVCVFFWFFKRDGEGEK